jgi:hypothetical protein
VAVILLTTLCTTSAALQAAPERVGASVSAEWILARIQRPLPASTPFLELRGSRLLKAPLRIGGRYLRPDADTLVREVSSPYEETTTLHGGEVQIARKGQSTRRFQLSRAPQLAALQASFGALLSGDRVQLERHYTLTSSGQTTRWKLVLTPKDAAMKTTVRDIVLHGRGAELRCIETNAARGEAQRTLLAGAAAEAATLTDAQSLARLCDGNSHG